MARITMTESEYKSFLTRTSGKTGPQKDIITSQKQILGPNKTELRFSRDKLDVWVHEGRLAGYMWEPYRLSVVLDAGNRMTYRPDFLAWDSVGRVTMFEVKGARVWDDAKVKFLMARQMFLFWTWEAWQWKGGEWNLIWGVRRGC